MDVRNQVAKINEFVQEHVTGMHIVQAFNREQVEAEAFSEINAAHREANIRSIWAFSVFFPVVEMLSATSVGLLLWLGIGHVVQGGLTLGVVLQFILYVFMLYRPIRQLADRFNVLQMGIVNADRVFKLLDRDDSIPEPERPQSRVGRVKSRLKTCGLPMSTMRMARQIGCCVGSISWSSLESAWPLSVQRERGKVPL